MNIFGISFLSLIVGFFFAISVSYYTAYNLNDRYEFSPDRPKNFKLYKSIYSLLSFLATFIIIIAIFYVL